VQDLRRDFVPTPSQVPGSSQTKLAFVPPPKLTKHQEELRKQAISRKMSRLLTSEELSEIDMKRRQRELKRKAALATPPARTTSAPSSSAPARISISNQSPPRKKRTKRNTAPDRAPIPLAQAETQDMDEWEMLWDRERLIDQGVLLDSSSSEEEPDFKGESMDLCEINTQDRDLMEGYDVRRLQETGDTQETAIEID
jgi:hypothetical protein